MEKANTTKKSNHRNFHTKNTYNNLHISTNNEIEPQFEI